MATLLVLALAVAACDSGTAVETTASVGATTVENPDVPATTTTAPPDTAPPTTNGPVVMGSDGLDPAVIDQLTVQIVELIAATEGVRGLPFLSQPMVTILTPEELEARVRADIAEEIVPEEIAVDERLLQLLGLLGPQDDLERLLIDLYGEQVAGFYDLETGEMVIGGEAAELTPYIKSVIVHELVHALTDQHFLFNDEYLAMWDEERYEEGSAFQALMEGDATYFQFVYMQELPLAEQLALATEALELYEASAPDDSVPAWILNDLSFPYETGQVFVESLVGAGGITAVDTAYSNRPLSTEVVMHPSRYAAGELVIDVAPVSISLDGYEVHETSTYGEWGLRVLLGENAAPGVAVQAANGWGGDSYQVLHNANDIVFALAYKGDSEDDAFELTDALITMVGESLEMGEGFGDGGGITFNAEDGRFAHVDRIGDGLILVLSTDATAGAGAVDQLRVP